MQRALHFVDESHQLKLAKKPTNVWTLLVRAGTTPTIPDQLIHGRTAFFEDEVHDWRWKNGVLRYFSRLVDTKETAWIVVEFND